MLRCVICDAAFRLLDLKADPHTHKIKLVLKVSIAAYNATKRIEITYSVYVKLRYILRIKYTQFFVQSRKYNEIKSEKIDYA